jgi:hypothetical protein
MAKAPRPEVTTLTGAQLEQLLAEVRPLVPAATYQLLAGLLQTLEWIMAAFEQKTLSIGSSIIKRGPNRGLGLIYQGVCAPG